MQVRKLPLHPLLCPDQQVQLACAAGLLYGLVWFGDFWRLSESPPNPHLSSQLLSFAMPVSRRNKGLREIEGGLRGTQPEVK